MAKGKLDIRNNVTLDINDYKLILESTGRFEHVILDKVTNSVSFWDNRWENTHTLRADCDLKELMDWILKFYEEDYRDDGVRQAQRKIREALGIDN